MGGIVSTPSAPKIAAPPPPPPVPKPDAGLDERQRDKDRARRGRRGISTGQLGVSGDSSGLLGS